MHNRTCRACGTEFEVTRPSVNKVYCQTECRIKTRFSNCESTASRISRYVREEPSPLQVDRLGRAIAGPCWIWTGYIHATTGYGQVRLREPRRQTGAHRASYELFVGPIANHIDHLCRVRACCNPSHLEDVTHAENIRRGDSHQRVKTHCPSGHPYSPENTRLGKNGGRYCRTCSRAAISRHYYRTKAEKAKSAA